MAPPNFSFFAEPTLPPLEAGSNYRLQFLNCVGRVNDYGSQKICIRLQMVNNTTTQDMIISGARFQTFEKPGGTPLAGQTTWYPVKNLTATPPVNPAQLTAGATVYWTPVIPDPVSMFSKKLGNPKLLVVQVYIKDIATPQERQYDLVEYTTPTYKFPFAPGNLDFGGNGEFFSGFASHVAGVQSFGHDITCRGLDKNGNQSLLLDGKTDNSIPQNYRMYGKIVRAMADGTVENPWFNTPDNGPVVYPKDGEKGPYDDAGANGAWDEDSTKTTYNPGGGNIVWINHGGAIRTLYAHMQGNNLFGITAGQKVLAGQPLGLVGFAGRISGAPHTHVHAEIYPTIKAGVMQPLPFVSTWVLPAESAKVGGANEGEFSKCHAEGLLGDSSNQLSLVVPGDTYPGYPIQSGAISWDSGAATQFETQVDWDTFMTRIVAQRKANLHPISIGSFKERASEPRRYGAVYQQGTSPSTVLAFGSYSDLQSEYVSRKTENLTWVHTYQGDGNKPFFVAIFRPKTDYDTILQYHGNATSRDADINNQFQSKIVATHAFTWVTLDGIRHWASLSRNGTWGGHFWTSKGKDDFLKQVATDSAGPNGRILTYFTTFRDDGTQTDNPRLGPAFYFGIMRDRFPGEFSAEGNVEQDLDTLRWRIRDVERVSRKGPFQVEFIA